MVYTPVSPAASKGKAKAKNHEEAEGLVVQSAAEVAAKFEVSMKGARWGHMRICQGLH